MAPEFENYSGTSHVLKSWLLLLHQLFYYVQHLPAFLTPSSALHTAVSLLEVAKSQHHSCATNYKPCPRCHHSFQQMLPCR